MCLYRAANITAEEAREALLSHVAEHCCYGKGAAQDMQMRHIEPSNALHVSYILSLIHLVQNTDLLLTISF